MWVAAAVVFASCGSDSSTVAEVGSSASDTTTTAAVAAVEDDAAAPVPVDPVAFAEEVAGQIDGLNAELDARAAVFLQNITDGPGRIAQDADWNAALAPAAAAAASGLPSDVDGAPSVDGLRSALTEWSATAQQAADDLYAAEAELAPIWGSPEADDQVEAIQTPVNDAQTAYEDACLEFGEGAAVMLGVAVDCLRVSDAPVEVVETTIMLGDRTVTASGPVGLIQKSDVLVAIESADPELGDDYWAEISVAPIFVDPTGPLESMRVDSSIDWPEDLAAWIDSIGGSIAAEGETTIGGVEARWWEFVGDGARLSELNPGGGAISMFAFDGVGEFEASFQLNDGIATRLYRLDLDDSIVVLASQGIATGGPADAEMPPFIPRDVQIWEWIDDVVIPSLTID